MRQGFGGDGLTGICRSVLVVNTIFVDADHQPQLEVEPSDDQLRFVLLLVFKGYMQIFADTLESDVFRGNTVFAPGQDVFAILHGVDLNRLALRVDTQLSGLGNGVAVYDRNIYDFVVHSRASREIAQGACR